MGTSVSDELIYTSAPRGIKPGSSGFCTVAATATLGPAWIERLELLSGYEPMYPLGDPREHQNPPIFRHLRLTIAGRTRSVVSRIGYVPADHTGRSNKIAHHVVLDDSELGPAGPAWLMRQGIFQTRWSGGDPRISTTGPTIPKLVVPALPALTWQSVTGDGGWAAELANPVVQGQADSITIVYPGNSEILALVDEAINLLPVAQRWNVTFDTLATQSSSPPCMWKCVLADAVVAAKIRGPVLDLTDDLGPAPQRELWAERQSAGTSISTDFTSQPAAEISAFHAQDRPRVLTSSAGQPPLLYLGSADAPPKRKAGWLVTAIALPAILLALVSAMIVVLTGGRPPQSSDVVPGSNSSNGELPSGAVHPASQPANENPVGPSPTTPEAFPRVPILVYGRLIFVPASSSTSETSRSRLSQATDHDSEEAPAALSVAASSPSASTDTAHDPSTSQDAQRQIDEERGALTRDAAGDTDAALTPPATSNAPSTQSASDLPQEGRSSEHKGGTQPPGEPSNDVGQGEPVFGEQQPANTAIWEIAKQPTFPIPKAPSPQSLVVLRDGGGWKVDKSSKVKVVLTHNSLNLSLAIELEENIIKSNLNDIISGLTKDDGGKQPRQESISRDRKLNAISNLLKTLEVRIRYVGGHKDHKVPLGTELPK